MYAVKVFHGYIAKDGHRTRDKSPEKLMIFSDKRQSELFAQRIGGRVKQIELREKQCWRAGGCSQKRFVTIKGENTL